MIGIRRLARVFCGPPLAAALALIASSSVAAPTGSPTPTATPTLSPTPKAPVFILDPVAQKANVGQTIKFFGEVEIPPPPPGAIPKDHIPAGIQYVWNKNSQLIDGATSNSLTLPSVTVSDDATYNCQATNAGGTATSGNARLIVHDPPKANDAFLLGISGPTQMVVNTTADCMVIMCDTSQITWSNPQGYRLAVVSDSSGFMQGAAAVYLSNDKEVIFAPGGTAYFSFKIKAPSGPGPRSLQLRMAENAALFGPTVTFNISVINTPPTPTPSPTSTIAPSPTATPSATPTPSPMPPVISRQPADLFANAGQSVKFFSGAFEPPIPGAPKDVISYQWMKNGSPLNGKTESSLALIDIDATDAAQYNCQATNGGGSTSSRIATLTVHNPAKPNLAELVGTTAPARMFVGQSLYVGVTMRNISEVSWSRPQGYSLAAVSDPGALLQGANRFHFNDEADVVAPQGGFYDFVVLLKGGGAPGVDTAQLRMIEEFGGTPLFGPVVSITIETIAQPNASGDWAVYE